MPTTLLLADDSVTIQRVIELTFADEDIEVVTVSDGDEAIAALGRTPRPDIVLADVAMPGRTGYEVAQYIRDEPSLAHIPVLLLTGAFEPVDQERAAAVGCSGVLAKPFEPQLVVTRVRELLAGQAGSREPVSSWQEPSTPTGSATAGPTPVAEYFDRLDQAFANFSTEVGGQPDLATGGQGSPSKEDEPTSESSADSAGPDADLAGAAVGATEVPAAPVAVEPTSAAAPVVPPLADAFSALLAAERTAPASGSPVWPATPTMAPVSEEIVEQVTRQVLERMTDRVVHDTVSAIVSEVAERLVREEIDRIKSAIE